MYFLIIQYDKPNIAYIIIIFCSISHIDHIPNVLRVYNTVNIETILKFYIFFFVSFFKKSLPSNPPHTLPPVRSPYHYINIIHDRKLYASPRRRVYNKRIEKSTICGGLRKTHNIIIYNIRTRFLQYIQ